MWKILKRRALLRKLNNDVISLRNKLEPLSDACFKYYTKKQAVALNILTHKLLATEKAIEKIHKL